MTKRAASYLDLPVDTARAGRRVSRRDAVASEEPVEIRLQWEGEGGPALRSIAVTMRTPGNDFELAAGFLFCEGIVRAREDIVDISYCPDSSEPHAHNIVTVTLAPGVLFDSSRLDRNFYTTSSCGVCGKSSLEALQVRGCTALSPGFTMPWGLVRQLPDRLAGRQAVFQKTGGLHAAGLFDAAGGLVELREDVGRHNALDKVIGQRFLAGLTPVDRNLLLVSGRASFELLQKALVAGIPFVAAVGAPSSLAVDLAKSFGMTLIGFVNREGFNIYTGGERVSDLPG